MWFWLAQNAMSHNGGKLNNVGAVTENWTIVFKQQNWTLLA